jgi:hypothetical protein
MGKNGTNHLKSPGPNFFWFRQNLKYIYYYDSKESHNSLGSIYFDNMHEARDILNSKRCFTIFMKDEGVYKLCAERSKIKKKWLCKIQKILGQITLSPVCFTAGPDTPDQPAAPYKIVPIVQPMILIPLPAKHCNEDWNYLKSIIIF